MNHATRAAALATLLGTSAAGPARAQAPAICPPVEAPAATAETTVAQARHAITQANAAARCAARHQAVRRDLDTARDKARIALARHQATIGPLNAETAALGQRLSVGLWIGNAGFSRLTAAGNEALGLPWEDGSRHDGGHNLKDPRPSQRRASAAELLNLAATLEAARDLEALRRAATSVTPGQPAQGNQPPPPPTIRQEVDDATLARIQTQAEGRRIRVQARPIHQRIVIASLTNECPRNTLDWDDPYPCGHGLRDGTGPGQHAPGAYDPLKPLPEAARAAGALWRRMTANRGGWGIAPHPGGAGSSAAHKREKMAECAFIAPGYDVHRVCHDEGWSCWWACNWHRVLNAGSPTIWLARWKKERFMACWTEGVDLGRPGWVRARCGRGLTRLHHRAAQGLEDQWLRNARGGCPAAPVDRARKSFTDILHRGACSASRARASATVEAIERERDARPDASAVREALAALDEVISAYAVHAAPYRAEADRARCEHAVIAACLDIDRAELGRQPPTAAAPACERIIVTSNARCSYRKGQTPTP